MLMLDKAKWNKAADVVVVGYGAAGAVSAITAQEYGADVLILEKQPSETHRSNSSFSGGAFISPSDVKGTEEYLHILTSVDKDTSWTDPEVIKVFAELACQNYEWVTTHGGEVRKMPETVGSHRELPGNELMQPYQFQEAGRGFMAFMKGVVSRNKTEIMYGVRSERLIVNHHGDVIGVAARAEDGAQINIKAVRAVILASGGFEFDEAMKLQFLRCYPVYFCGSPANTGDGIRMAMSVGADLWHMNCISAGLVMKFPDIPFSLTPAIRGGPLISQLTGRARATCGYIIVDSTGRRFTNENFKPHHAAYELGMYDSRAIGFPRIPSCWIMDHRRIAEGPLTASARTRGYHDWSIDNSKEIEMGWICCADTIRELGRQLGISAENLQRTVENYNSYCRGKDDPEFQRRPQSLVPLDTPPYYAVRLWPGGTNTLGGPRRNYKSQTLNIYREAVPGLYTVGELGSVFGMLYTGGGNLGECISFGRIAGEHAAKDKPRLIT